MKILRDITKSQYILLEKNGLLRNDKCVSATLNSNNKYEIDFISSKAYFEAYDFLFSDKRVEIIKELGNLEKNVNKENVTEEVKEEAEENDVLISRLEEAKEKEIEAGNYSVAAGIDKAIKIVKDYQINK